jgi:hypothetical protein
MNSPSRAHALFPSHSDASGATGLAAEPRSFAPRRARAPRTARERLRVGFPYLAQIHQAPHSLPIAVELARRHPEVEVRVAALTTGHLDFVRAYARLFPEAHMGFDLLALPELVRDGIGRNGHQVGRKLMGLVLNRSYFDSFDALVVPERTSLILRRLGVRRPKLIWTRHGAGDRASGFQQEIAKFDFVIMAGAKLERRLLDAGLIRPGHYVTGVYAKFDYVGLKPRPRPPFDNGRPTILYNPHFRRSLSSWPLAGAAVLDWAAGQADYNLVFAPHLRLFDPPTERKYEAFHGYRDAPHVRIDLGSTASVDMTYTLSADIYLGDVSSQVAEFVTRPRPCVFLNPRRFAWRGDPNFAFWELGEVTEAADRLSDVMPAAIAAQSSRDRRQRDYVADTFGAPGEPTAHIGADAIATYLGGAAAGGRWVSGASIGQPIEAARPI